MAIAKDSNKKNILDLDPELKDIAALKDYFRAANYLVVTQLYLKSNFLLNKRLSVTDIKSRILGHWGTCPGINFVYANLNYFIKKHKKSVLFILGPGHGFPALQANLFLEQTLEKFYPQATQTESGIGYLSREFSWPYGFPSHTWAGCPGSISAGGELGYALPIAFGAAIGNPDLIVACLIGDGEAETGTTATSWHLNKFIDPKADGSVLPILHLNGYKISGPSIFGRMPEKELKNLFKGYGYIPLIVTGTNIFKKMIIALEEAYNLLKKIKSGKLEPVGNYPLIILKTPKGWTGPKTIAGKKIEGNNLSHKAVDDNAKHDLAELQILNRWLKSYKFQELFNSKTGFNKEILSLLPEQKLRMGLNPHAYSGSQLKPLKLNSIDNFSVNIKEPGQVESSSMEIASNYLEEIFKDNNTVRLLSPDEIYSNKLGNILKVTHTVFNLPIKPWDQDLSKHGKVISMLSENALQGIAQGYNLTGRRSIFATYEAFADIISSMVDQYAKFIFNSLKFSWRGNTGSLTYILTSTVWRQDNNGFSHQNPALVSNLIDKQFDFVKAYYPFDSNSMLAALENSFKIDNNINLITVAKRDTLMWFNAQDAKKQISKGFAIWPFASRFSLKNNKLSLEKLNFTKITELTEPDIIFCGVGDHMTQECLAAIQLLEQELPEAKFRFVNISVINGLGIGYSGDISESEFIEYFTETKPIIVNFHGYPNTIKALLFNKPNPERIKVFGYIERGSTTTPFDMLTRNKVDRFNLSIVALNLLRENKIISQDKADKLINLYKNILEEHKKFIIENGFDPEPIKNWKWRKNI